MFCFLRVYIVLFLFFARLRGRAASRARRSHVRDKSQTESRCELSPRVLRMGRIPMHRPTPPQPWGVGPGEAPPQTRPPAPPPLGSRAPGGGEPTTKGLKFLHAESTAPLRGSPYGATQWLGPQASPPQHFGVFVPRRHKPYEHPHGHSRQ